ncbi:unnamed protein product [Allacma fusca]|uniref:Uncharacterized protein n=1 Tax=Allacma fusca TaxID=39272 RepID=A0A8J2JT95_9HEXA|nr:unnamed protein product [Allacma fusca]
MKAPFHAITASDCQEYEMENGKGHSTAGLMKWIADVTIKRRQMRRKFRCSNLLAEAILTNSLKEAKRELALKQEDKRKKLQNFNYKLTMTIQGASPESEENDAAMNNTLQNCLSSLDSFFNELKSVKS